MRRGGGEWVLPWLGLAGSNNAGKGKIEEGEEGIHMIALGFRRAACLFCSGNVVAFCLRVS